MEFINSTNPGLPPEILLQIFSYFPAEEIASKITLVCKKWNELANNEELWKKITLSKFGTDKSEAEFKKKEKWKTTYISLKKEPLILPKKASYVAEKSIKMENHTSIAIEAVKLEAIKISKAFMERQFGSRRP